MPEILLRFYHRPSDARPISSDSYLHFSADGRNVVKTNLKINVNLDFTAGITKELLDACFGAAACITYIKREPNQKGVMTDFHGVVPVANLGDLIARGLVPTFSHGGIYYDLLEVGVNINLFQTHHGFLYDRKNKNSIEIKFNKRGDPSFRLVVDIHMNHTAGVCVDDGVSELDRLANLLYTDANVSQELIFCKSVNIFDFKQYGYELADKSLNYYPAIASLHARTRIATLEKTVGDEAKAREAVEVKLSAEIAAREASDLKLNELKGQLQVEVGARDTLDVKVVELENMLGQLRAELALQKAEGSAAAYKPGLFKS